MSSVYRFPGGIHPQEGVGGKAATAGLPIVEVPQPSRVAIPLQQHIGAPCKPLVQKGDTVKAGQKIGEPVGFVSAAVHASISGKVVDVLPCIVANGTQVNSVVIDNDFQDTWVELHPVVDPENLNAKELADLCREMGIVGMGGATFPTAVKLSVPEGKKVDTLVINGAECEPYLSADHRLMLEKSEEIVQGIEIVRRALSISAVKIGIESNKPDAIEMMKKACDGHEGIEIVSLPARYPQGGEKQLVYALTGRKVRNGALPLDIGVIVLNVDTCYVIRRAVYEGRPVVDRVLTVGGTVQKPANYLARIGSPVEWFLDTSGGLLPETRMLIYGGPMMGMAISREDIPVTKGCSGILALDKLSALEEEGPCIRCGRCVDACPMLLSPTQIDQCMRKDLYEDAEALGVMNCMECGACSWSCPSRRNLTQSCRICKMIITKHRREAAGKGGK